MEVSRRIISKLPLQELWDERGPVDGERLRYLNSSAIRDLLRQGAVRFVIADIGAEPAWIPESCCFDFWKQDVQRHLADPEQRVNLAEFPDDFCYFASEWSAPIGTAIIVLERCH